MATNTYVALDEVTVGIATPSITFSSIPQGYTDLVLIINAGTSDASEQDCLIRVNGDTGSNYSATYLYGTGSSAASGGNTNQTESTAGYPIRPTLISTLIVQFPNYSNTTTYKNWLGRANSADSMVYTHISLWRNTNAINTILLYPSNSKNFLAGSTFSLYGIAAEGTTPAPKATGGAIYSDEDYYYHVFGSTGVFTPSTSLTADVLVVAGGGAGGGQNAGGGGAGGLLSFTSQSLSATNYTCTVGAGGAGSYPGGATNGGNSQFGALTASVGGGLGGCFTGGLTQSAGSGGSGGGAHGNGSANFTGGSGTAGQGFAGGNSLSAYATYAGAGGGGAGAIGSNVGGHEIGGNGGIGATSSLINTIGLATGVAQLSSGNYYLAGGGGGAGLTTQGVGGAGGGGTASGVTLSVGQPGIFATGGGGGATRGADPGGNGGSGVVIVRYLKA